MKIKNRIKMIVERKKAILSYPPEWITIAVTSACSYKCTFCSYHGEDAKDKSNVYGLPYMLPLEQFKRMTDMAVDGGIDHVHICGTGEPFFHPQIFEMMDYVAERVGRVSFQTDFNNRLFTEKDILRKIVERKDKISYITTDMFSTTPEIHERIKLGSNYNELIKCLKFLSDNTDILLKINVIVTRSDYEGISSIVQDLYDYGIRNYRVSYINLFSYDYSDFTSSENVYTSLDKDITHELKCAKTIGRKLGIRVVIPKPADKCKHKCNVYWQKFQTWPVKGCDSERYAENMIPHACAAVVCGEINSLGYLLDYDSIMDAWNSEELVRIRKMLLRGEYPDDKCKKCLMYHKEDGYYKEKVKNEI